MYQQEAKLMALVSSLQSTLQSEQQMTTKAIEAAEARLLTLSSSESAQLRSMLANHVSMQAEALEQLRDSTSSLVATTGQALNESVAAHTSLADKQLTAHVADVRQHLLQHSSDMDKRFTTFKSGVASTVTELHTSISLLNHKADELANRINKILQTVVIVT